MPNLKKRFTAIYVNTDEGDWTLEAVLRTSNPTVEELAASSKHKTITFDNLEDVPETLDRESDRHPDDSLPADCTIGVIAISGKKLAIFGSRMGFMGPVIQQYIPFTDEALAIAAARGKIKELGLPDQEEISRPYIKSARLSTSRRRKIKA